MGEIRNTIVWTKWDIPLHLELCLQCCEQQNLGKSLAACHKLGSVSFWGHPGGRGWEVELFKEPQQTVLRVSTISMKPIIITSPATTLALGQRWHLAALWGQVWSLNGWQTWGATKWVGNRWELGQDTPRIILWSTHPDREATSVPSWGGDSKVRSKAWEFLPRFMVSLPLWVCVKNVKFKENLY